VTVGDHQQYNDYNYNCNNNRRRRREKNVA
jgi:hypothetical protein